MNDNETANKLCMNNSKYQKTMSLNSVEKCCVAQNSVEFCIQLDSHWVEAYNQGIFTHARTQNVCFQSTLSWESTE